MTKLSNEQEVAIREQSRLNANRLVQDVVGADDQDRAIRQAILVDQIAQLFDLIRAAEIYEVRTELKVGWA